MGALPCPVRVNQAVRAPVRAPRGLCPTVRPSEEEMFEARERYAKALEALLGCAPEARSIGGEGHGRGP